MAYGITALPAYTVFYLPATGTAAPRPYIEFYWQIDPNSIEFSKDEKGIWLGKIKTEIELYSDTGIIAREKYYLQTTPAASLKAAQLQNIMDLHRYMVGQGEVHMKLTLTATKAGKEEQFQYTDSVTITAPEKVFYSQFQLIDTSYKTDVKEHIFLKNDNLQIPLCMNFLADNRKLLHYYVELQGTQNIPADQLPLTQKIFISKKEFDYAIYDLTVTDTLEPVTVLPVYGQLKIDVLPSGNYYLNAVLYNSKGQTLAKQTMFFQRSNVKPVVISAPDTGSGDSTQPVFEKVNLFDLSKTFVGKYTIAQQKAIIKMLKPIATETELLSINAFIKRPEPTYMRYFIYNFWNTRTPGDPEKGWLDYTKQVKEVNKMFGGSKPGYESERGFYYLKYGPPDQRYVVTAEQGALPYEVWQYNSPGTQSNAGAFLFYNPGFMGQEYVLLHSTVRGEMRNTNWRANLYANGTSTNNLNSRAEQIFPTK